jgi:hypothetical protein
MESEATALKEPLYEKYSWIFLLVAPLILSILNIQALVYGYSFSAPSGSGKISVASLDEGPQIFFRVTFRLLAFSCA